MAGKPTYEELEKRVQELETIAFETKKQSDGKTNFVAENLPLEEAEQISFKDLFDLDDIQKLQDQFSSATGVASIITHTDGTPITRPSNFCRLCKDVIRKTEKGRANCYKSDAVIGRLVHEGPTIQRCMSGGLWDAGAAISVGGRHIANWLIGQVRDDTQTEEKMRAYAKEIGADEEKTVEAFRQVPLMSRERFGHIAQMLFTLANQISKIAYRNMQLVSIIREYEQSEKALKKNEAYLRTLVRTIPDLIWLKDSQGIYLLCNAKFERLFGAKEIDIVGKTDYDFVSKELADFFRRNDQLAMEKGGPSKNEEEVTYADDGHHEFLETIKTPIRSDDGTLAGVIGIGRDITERKQAERERLATLRFFESLDQVNRAMQGASDLEQMMRDALDAVLSIFDCDRAALLYVYDTSISLKIPMERTRPDYPGAFQLGLELPASMFVRQTFKKLLETQGPITLNIGSDVDPEEAAFKQFGIKSMLLIALYPKVGKPWQFCLHQCSYNRKWKQEEKQLFQEISRRLADGLTSLLVVRDLRKSEESFRIIFENAADPIYLSDMKTGVFIDVNSAACRHLGYDKQELLQLSWNRVNGAGAFDPFAHFSRPHKADESVFFESKHLRKDGSIAIVEVNSQRVQHQGRTTLLSTARDVTLRKQIEAELAGYREDLEKMVAERTGQLQAAQDELVKKEKLAVLGQLTATVSHELRNPLGVIRSSNFFLQRKIDVKDEKTEKHFHRIDQQVSICDAIVDDLLEYTRGRKAVIGKKDIGQWLPEVVEQIKEQEKIEIKLNMDAYLSPVYHDPEKMRRVIINLLKNAAQAINAKIEKLDENAREFAPRIEVAVHQREEDLMITVSDNGIGMSPETCRRAFEPLFTTRARGTGIGLAIVKKILQEHNGDISVESEPDKGTRMTLTLPHPAQETL